MKNIFRRGKHEMSAAQRSVLYQDINNLWCSDKDFPGRAEDIEILFGGLKAQAPGDAREAVVELMGDEIQLEQRLGRLGIVCGELTPNAGIPGGVYGVWRSDRPLVLMTEEVPVGTDRALELARSVGRLVYLEDETSAAEFAQRLKGNFVTIRSDQYVPQ